MKTSFNIKIGGAAGEGIKVSGLTLARSLTRLGYQIFGYSEYPSLIRGGHNTYQLHAGIKQVYSQIKAVDVLIALNKETVEIHQPELCSSSLILYDPGDFKLPAGKLKGKYIGIEFIKLAQEAGGKPIMANMASLASTLTLLGLPIASLKEIIKKEFKRKSMDIVKINQKIAEAGRQVIEDKFSKLKLKVKMPPQDAGKKLVLTGNEACSLGAIAGGLQFFAAYPMTPATSILHYLAQTAKNTGILVKHAEDEISVANMALGGSFAGARSMTATSGGGLCLMAEAISMAGIAELPLVVVNSMRPGPALGMPTWTAQGDLQFVLNIGHDEFPRIVLAPGDANEAFALSKLSFELAEKYQLPVFILLDKYLSESDYAVSPFPEKHLNQRFSSASKSDLKTNRFKRYKLTSNGISPRTVPGQKNGIHCCNSYEHDEEGLGIEDGKTRNLMMEKRASKLNEVKKQIPPQQVFGPDNAEISLISWGSNKPVCLEALKNLPHVNFLHLNWLWPFPKKQVKDFIKTGKKTVCLEANSTGQLAKLIRQELGVEVESLFKYNGRPFYPEEIAGELK
jgi:2-oxoglutarate/2-oxoacid ferredoxin oxidoreductase subunit alpha